MGAILYSMNSDRTNEELTSAQKRYLREIREADREGRPPKVYNGRARRTIEALEEAGLVEADWDMIPQAKGNGMELVERITVWPR